MIGDSAVGRQHSESQRTPMPHAMVVGVYQLDLSEVERQAFRRAVLASCQTIDFRAANIVEELNFDAVCFPARGFMFGEEALRVGGNCVLASGGNGYWTRSRIDGFRAKLGGAWSAAIADEVTGLWLARDFAGAHTMYYALVGRAIYFSSSMTLLRRFQFEIDRDAVAEFLHFLYIPAPRTIFKNVFALLPGQQLFFDGQSIQLHESQLDLHECPPDSGESGVDPLSRFERKLIRAVGAACPQHGKLAVLLSGGKDSSTLAIAAKLGNLRNVEAINLAFDQREIDESGDARRVAESLGLPFRALNFSGNTYVRHWESFIRHLGQPMGDGAALPMFVAMKELGDEYVAYLDGTGNDGYFGIPASAVDQLAWRIHRLIPRLELLPFRLIPRGLSWSLDLMLCALSRSRQEQFVSWNGWTGRELKRLLGFSPDWRGTRLYRSYDSWSTAMDAKTNVLCGLWEPEAAYRKSIQIAASQAKWVVHPFLENDLVKFCRDLPKEWKFEGQNNKTILRALMRKHLPTEILGKSKGSFVFPRDVILASNNYAIPLALLAPENVRMHGFVDPIVVTEFLSRYRSGERQLQDLIWALVVLHAWLKEQDEH